MDDSKIKKVMRSKDDWVKKLSALKDEFIQYEVLVQTGHQASVLKLMGSIPSWQLNSKL